MRAIGFLIKCFLVIVIVLAVISYVNYLKTGYFWEPKISFNSATPFFDNKPVMRTLEPVDEGIYKWRENGEWVYGDKPPAGVNAQPVDGEN